MLSSPLAWPRIADTSYCEPWCRRERRSPPCGPGSSSECGSEPGVRKPGAAVLGAIPGAREYHKRLSVLQPEGRVSA